MLPTSLFELVGTARLGDLGGRLAQDDSLWATRPLRIDPREETAPASFARTIVHNAPRRPPALHPDEDSIVNGGLLAPLPARFQTPVHAATPAAGPASR